MATSKQVYYVHSLIGKAISEDKAESKSEVWDLLELLPETKLEELDNKEMSEVIKKLDKLVK